MFLERERGGVWYNTRIKKLEVEVLDTSSSCSERARVTQVLVRQRDGEEMLWSFLVAAHCLGFPGNDGTC